MPANPRSAFLLLAALACAPAPAGRAPAADAAAPAEGRADAPPRVPDAAPDARIPGPAPDAGIPDAAVAPADGPGLGEALERARQEQHAVGAALGLRTAAGTWLGAAGARAPGGAPLAPSDRFQIASISKTFVATLVLLEVDAGRLRLDDAIAPWWPELPSSDRITLRHLLQHTSGLAEHLADPGLDPLRPTTPRQLLAWVATQPLAFEPGERHDYSNSNYIALGLILEEVAGQPLGRQLAERIATPLGLGDTYLHEAGTEAPPGYWYEGGRYVADPQEHPTVVWAAGAVISTPADLLDFFAALLGGALLPPARLAEMQTGVPVPGSDGRASYGLGLMWEQTPAGRLYFHGGLTDNTLSVAGGLEGGRLYLAGYFNTMPTDDLALVRIALGALPP